MTSDYLCNLLIPGAEKSGTTTLAYLLDMHPDVCLSDPKEPAFFAFDELYAGGCEHHNALFRPESDNCRYFADGSQAYFCNQEAISRIRRDLSEPKIIVILRHPVDRAFSQYRYNVAQNLEHRRFEDALLADGEDPRYFFDSRSKTYRERCGYLAFSRYSRYVPLWEATFGKENVHVVLFDDLVERQQDVADSCFGFLGLKAVEIDDTIVRNATSDARRADVPWYLTACAKLLPKKLKRRTYDKLKTRLLKPATPTPPEKMSASQERLLFERLSKEIAYYHAKEEELGRKPGHARVR